MNKLPLDRQRWPLVALLASAAALAFAYFLEFVHFQAPCQMCWWQRYVYFTAIPTALAAVALNWRGAGPRLLTALSILIGLVFLTGFGIATWHALFEWGIAPGPEGCTAINVGAINSDVSLWEQMQGRLAIPSCKEALWRVPNEPWGLSMAGLNAVFSLVLAGLSLFSASQPPITQADTANEPVQP
jgi:disulfide bond formation protein DsbB